MFQTRKSVHRLVEESFELKPKTLVLIQPIPPPVIACRDSTVSRCLGKMLYSSYVPDFSKSRCTTFVAYPRFFRFRRITSASIERCRPPCIPAQRLNNIFPRLCNEGPNTPANFQSAQGLARLREQQCNASGLDSLLKDSSAKRNPDSARNPTSNTRSASDGIPYRKPKFTTEISSGRGAVFWKLRITNCRSSCTLNFDVSITTSASRRIGAILRRSARMPSATDRPSPIGCGRRVSLKRRIRYFVACFDKNQRRRTVGRERAVNSRKILDLPALTRIHEKRSPLDFACAAPINLAEHRNQRHRQVVDAVVAQVLECIQHRAFS